MLANTLLAGWHGLLGNRSARTAAATRTAAADPLSPFTFSLIGQSYYYTADYADALAHQDRALALEPDCLNALWGAALSLAELGDYTEAIRRVQRAVSISQQSPTTLGMLAYILGKAGDATESRRLVDQLWLEYPEHAHCHLGAELCIGDEARLTRALRHALNTGVGGAIALATTVKPGLDRIAGHPRLGLLLRQFDLYAQMPGLPVLPDE